MQQATHFPQTNSSVVIPPVISQFELPSHSALPVPLTMDKHHSMKDSRQLHPNILASSKNLPTLKGYLDDENASHKANRNLSQNATKTKLEQPGLADERTKQLQSEVPNGVPVPSLG